MKIFKFNQELVLLQKSFFNLAPLLNTWGEGSFTPTDVSPLKHVKYHRFGQWRESNINDMLHLNYAQRLRSGMGMVNYLMHQFNIKQSEHGGKQEA